MRPLRHTFLLALLLSTQAMGQENPSDLQCKGIGELVMHTWYTLDLCVHHQQLGKTEVRAAQQSIARVYPKMGHAIASGSPLAIHAQAVANGLPYDFSSSKNAVLLDSICTNSIDAMHQYAEKKWHKTLACWQ